MNYRHKISFEESLELPELNEEERQQELEWFESENYYETAPTAAERNR